jgi:alpha-glucosidase
MWERDVDSGVNSLYVSDLYPKTGEDIVLSIRVPGEGIDRVLLVTFTADRQENRACKRRGDVYFATVRIGHPEGLWWHFVIAKDDSFWYYSEKGLCRSVPVLRDCFFLKPDLRAARWAASSTCYQIFPDRFRKGDPSLGARDGQYSFDGGTVTVHPFSDAPVPYQKGRCLDFFNGDIPGIEEKLGYLKDKGFDTVYLNPIGSSMTTHRYDCTDYFHVDPKLGGDEAFVRLMEKAHAMDMRVILDISINHTGVEHPWFKAALSDPSCKERGFYYFGEDGKARYWNGVQTLAQLNYGSKELQKIVYGDSRSVLQKFLKKPFCLDGWRLDVAPEVGRTESDDYCHRVWREVHDHVKDVNKNAYLVGEDWLDSSSHLQGDEWDATMNYLGCSRPLRAWMGETDRYLSEGWGADPKTTRPYSGADLATAISEAILSVPSQMRFLQFNVIDTHDIPRLSWRGRENFPVFAGCVMLQYLLPGMPCTYYGDEVGLKGPYGTLEDCRYPMEWDERKWDGRYVSLYAELAETRKKYRDLLSFGAWRVVGTGPEQLAFARYDRNRAVVAVLNRSKTSSKLLLDNAVMGMTRAEETRNVVFHGSEAELTLAPDENLLLHLSNDL